MGGGGPSGGYAYSTTWNQLESRASAGCTWCKLVFATRADADLESSKADTPLAIVVGSQGCLRSVNSPNGVQDVSVFIDGELHFLGYVYTTASKSGRRMSFLRTIIEPCRLDDPLAAHIILRDRILDVGSSAALSLARACIEECTRRHQRCVPPPVPPPLLPTRLIDCSNLDKLRLTDTLGERGTYLALSYVWGEPQPHSTTTSNISAYKQHIDSMHLPQTILDAVRVTNALGFRYLWADTLCIIQDSVEDQANEIARMRHIYRDAYCTVIASNATRVGLGFLQNRPAAPLTEYGTFSRDLALPFVCPPAEDAGLQSSTPIQVGELHVSPVWTYSDPVEQPLAQYDPSSEPISRRGWCMQEYLMSSRALVFASHTLQFHCQTSSLNVGGSFNDDFPGQQRLPDVLFLQDPPVVERGSKQWTEVRSAWQAVVRNYTARSVTKPSDKLIACGGISEEFQRVLRTDYLAGLWRDTLLGDLLWSKRTDVDIPRPKDYRAPTWSWAAVDGRVEAGAPDVKTHDTVHVAEVIRCEVVLQHDQLPFGGVTAGTLVLRTPLIRCSWNIETPNYLLRVGSLPDRDALASADDDEEVDVEVEQIGIGYLDSEDDADIQGVWAIPIHWSENIMAGLVITLDLTDLHRGGERVYRRIGFYETSANAGPVDWVKTLPMVDIALV